MHSAHAPVCPYCSNVAVLVDSIEVYGESYGMLWRCVPCDAHVGVHRNSPEYKPLGTLANADLRRARNTAHQLFDPIWRNGSLSRAAAYSMLQQLMELPEDRAHIAMFDIEECRIFVARLTDHLASPQGMKLTRPKMSKHEEKACNFLDSLMSMKPHTDISKGKR